jgi:hypothetical protein
MVAIASEQHDETLTTKKLRELIHKRFQHLSSVRPERALS